MEKTKESKESKMVICDAVNSFCESVGCVCRKPHEYNPKFCEMACIRNEQPKCIFPKECKCIPVEHPQNTENKMKKNPRLEKLYANIPQETKNLVDIQFLNIEVTWLKNKVAELEQQIRELKLCDCSLKQQPLKDANFYTVTKTGETKIEIPISKKITKIKTTH